MKGGQKQMQTITEEEIKQQIATLKSKRKDKRVEEIKNISFNIISLFKSRANLSFSRTTINNFIEIDALKERTKQKIASEILSLLIAEKIISEESHNKPIYFFRNKPLISLDGGSYNLMMKRNGYKKHLTKWIQNNKGYPEQIKIGVAEIGEPLPSDLDFNTIETKSHKRTQGVYTTGSLSVVKAKFYSPNKIYSIL